MKDVESSSSRICVSAEIWARFIDFEGIQYISSLSNSCDKHHMVSVFKPEPLLPIDSVYIGENYLGVMQVLFCSSTQTPAAKRRRDLWWRIIRLGERDPSLIIQTDGLKIREIIPATKATDSQCSLWSVPPSGPVRPVQLEPSSPATQLSMLVCNLPGVTAYSVYWDYRIISFHAHVAGENLTFYEGCEDGVWMYFPLEEGEKISEIWKYSQFKRGSGLIFRTTYGRIAHLCPQPKLQPHPAPTLIDLPRQDKGSRLFFEHSPLGVRNLSFETPKPVSASDPPTLPEPLSKHPKSTFFESYFYSSALLDGVIKIVPCQRNLRGKQHIIGLLLQFPERRQSCVGQIRLDCLGSPLQLDDHQSIWLGFSTDDYRPFVSVLQLSESKPNEDLSWLEVQPCNTLEWWFSLRQCQVCYMGKSSPPTRL
ncbi:hypothetical protein CORC01_14386 [Colletotrichum orchidophilum]|uniref:Uncharacterized protein n=1 Tax=Colletotrichum orchidophilum TaxID=1209926 RepID=A0A1G4AMP4_9PEZI|nr:uncharacterized protein CORC01_14386 [Colletotrichum orchidophilum]OHE90313.1 hypothetical protein CORC01_14386 [Colletotrichum orchidophilum]